ncbi:hypothetical protein AB5I41_04695 [Sphingomonas sp. MMS24-JH45]
MRIWHGWPSCCGASTGEIVDAAWADNATGWIAVMLKSADAVLAVNAAPFGAGSERLNVGVVGAHQPDGDAALNCARSSRRGMAG